MRKRLSAKASRALNIQELKRKKLLIYGLSGILMIPLFLLAVWSWKFQGKRTEKNNNWKNFIQELGTSLETFKEDIGRIKGEMSAPAVEENRILSNPENMPEDEVKKIEKKVFGE